MLNHLPTLVNSCLWSSRRKAAAGHLLHLQDEAFLPPPQLVYLDFYLVFPPAQMGEQGLIFLNELVSINITSR